MVGKNISYYKSIGRRLINLTEGGDNPPSGKNRKPTPEQIERIKKSGSNG